MTGIINYLEFLEFLKDGLLINPKWKNFTQICEAPLIAEWLDFRKDTV